MAKLIAFILVLGLSVPVQAWHLFPVREKIVTVKETNYAACAITGILMVVCTLSVGLIFKKPKKLVSVGTYEQDFLCKLPFPQVLEALNTTLAPYNIIIEVTQSPDAKIPESEADYFASAGLRLFAWKDGYKNFIYPIPFDRLAELGREIAEDGHREVFDRAEREAAAASGSRTKIYSPSDKKEAE
jgi:hypothetical protein